MKISVALCTYNGEAFLEEQLESILSQQLAVHEIVVCDDGSDDDTWSILEKYSENYPGLFRLCRNSNNIGFFKNFENCISLCENDIILLCDQDDVWHKDKTEKLVNFFSANPGKEVVFSNADLTGQLHSESTKMWGLLNFDKKKQAMINDPAKSFFWLLCNGNVATGATMALRNKEHYLPFFEAVGWLHDGSIAITAAAVGKLHCINECLIDYRQHPGQNVGTAGAKTVFNEPLSQRGLKKIKQLQWIQRCPQTDILGRIDFIKQVINKTNSSICRSLLRSEELRYKYYKSRIKLFIPLVYGYYKNIGGFGLFLRELLGTDLQTTTAEIK